MEDDPLEAEFAIVRRLKHLSQRYRKGLGKLHPINEKQLALTRKAILEDWQQEQKEKAAHHGKTKDKEKEQAEKQREEQDDRLGKSKKSNSNDQGHSQSH